MKNSVVSQNNIVLFFNPKSGRYKKSIILQVEKKLNQKFGSCTLIKDISELAQIQNAHIIVAGGDGTLHTAINHASIESNSFSIIPMGSGNDFIKNFGKYNLDILLQNISEKAITYVDLIKTGNIYSHTVTGVGFEALISKKANSKKNRIPALKFVIPVLKNMLFYKPIEISVESENFRFKGKAFMLSIGNGKRAGGGFKLFPKAEFTDGLMDLMVIKNPGPIQKLIYFWLVCFGKHLNLDVVEYAQLKDAEVKLTDPTLLNADGDVYETGSYTVSVERGIFKLIQ